MTTPDEVAAATVIARQFYDYLKARPGADWSAIFCAGWTAVPPMPNAPDQVAGYCTLVDQLRRGVPDLVVETVEVIANEDVVAVRSQVSGTNTGTLFGNPPTGKPFVFTAMDIHRISAGQIVQTWHVEDFARMLEQLA